MSFSLWGQNEELQSQLKNAKEDTSKVNLLCELSEASRNNDPDLAMNYADQALQLAEKLNFQKGLINAYNNLGICNGLLGNLPLAEECFKKTIELRNLSGDTIENHKAYNNIALIYKIKGDNYRALYYLKKSLNLRKLIKDSVQIATSLNNIATIRTNQGKLSLALDHLYEALRIQEKLNNKQGISNACNNIGNILLRQEKYDQSLQYLFRSLSIDKELNNKRGMATSYSNIGKIYSEKSMYERALEYDYLALMIQKQIKDDRGIGETYLEIGELLIKQKDLERALSYVLKARDIFLKYDMKSEEAQVYNDLATIAIKKNEARSALEYALKALLIGRDVNSSPIIQEAYLISSLAKEHLGMYKESLQDFKLYAGLNDSIYKQQVEEKIASLQLKYKEAQKEKQIQLLKKDQQVKDIKLKKNQTFGYFLTGGLSLVLLLALFIFRAYRMKKKANDLLSIRNKEVLEQKEIIEEKSNNITDSIEYAKRIQDAILPSEEEIGECMTNYFILFKPKAIVSGDFYWLHKSKSKLIFTVADCTGHGVPGAFMSMIGNTLLNEIVVEMGIEEPDKILNHLRDSIIKALRQKGDVDEARDGMDIALFTIEEKTNILDYAGAHNPLYHIRAGKLEELPADKRPVGYQRGMETGFTKHSLKLNKGDAIYIFSDGYADQFGGDDERKFKAEQFKNLLLSIRDMPMQVQKQKLEDAFNRWKGDVEQVDDVCVFGMKV